MGTTASIPFAHPDRFFINGEWVVPSGPTTFAVRNCATEEVFTPVAEAQAADIERAVEAARSAFDEGPWPSFSPAERAGYLRAIADGMDARQEDFARVWSVESGIVHNVATTTAQTFGTAFRFYASLAETFPFQEQQPTTSGGNVGLLVREPVGVVAAIVPWNGPGLMLTYKCAPALLAGCTMILKVSPEAPSSAYIFAEICEKVGLPAGVFNMLTADRAVSELLVREPRVDKVTFTGSTAAGRRIASLCGERIARCTLELGGKSAAIVLDDYDLETVAATLTPRVTFLTGQACANLTRIIVTRKRHDALVEALSSSFKGLVVGDPFDEGSQMGPLATQHQLDRVQGYIAKGKADGAKLAAGGKRPRHLDRGFFIEPTVFGHVDNQSTIAQEEIFGPVICVIAADNEDHAITLANDTIYGLNAAVFTNDVESAYRAARRLKSGTVGHNASRSDFGIAFGGVKQSGIGREGGIEGLLPFLESKTVVLDAFPASQKDQTENRVSPAEQ